MESEIYWARYSYGIYWYELVITPISSTNEVKKKSGQVFIERIEGQLKLLKQVIFNWGLAVNDHPKPMPSMGRTEYLPTFGCIFMVNVEYFLESL